MMAARIRVGSVVRDCVEFENMMVFWQEALHYEPKYPPDNGWVILRDPDGRGPNLSFNRVRKKTPGRNNLHLDLYSEDRESEVERLVSIGAKRHRRRYSPEDDFRVLEDPDGNLFCVVQLPKGAT
jgi:Glyoxalase-like domain